MSTLLPSELSMGDLERVRRQSKALFGNRYRMEIAAAVAGLETELFGRVPPGGGDSRS